MVIEDSKDDIINKQLQYMNVTSPDISMKGINYGKT